MNMKNVFEKTRFAFENNEVTELFRGQKDYGFDNLKHIPANVPTDINLILVYGVYPLCKETNIPVSECIKNAIKDLLNASLSDIWIAYFLAMCQKRNEVQGISPITVIDETVSLAISECVKNNKKELGRCKEWGGYGMQEGIYGDIVRLDNHLFEDYKVRLL